MKKPNVNKNEVRQPEEIWNAVIAALVEYEYPTESEAVNDAFNLFHYYSGMESGGHEGFLSAAEDMIEAVGSEHYFQELIAALEKIGAHDCARIEKAYGQKLWSLYQALEHDESEEDPFYRLIEKADEEYGRLGGKLEQMLEGYFIEHYHDFIDVVEK
ncbi:hypothetical protein M3212_17055 [Alkalihalobacillus oceani]|uniref:DMP19 family protein n=1 Tax=Halalkalibacter oceani TaxID=1653776 RepID=UPI0020419668|nr:hypothetical protein [Halalkalibacter oceani]MCM3762482.1 hypothetical protein [Halalkalibacter oceani]